MLGGFSYVKMSKKEFICMEKLKRIPAVPMRLMCLFLVLICMLGLLPSTAFAAGPNTIVMEDCTHNGVYYESAALAPAGCTR